MLNFSFSKLLMIWLTVIVGLIFAMPNGFYSRVEAHNDALAIIETGQTNAELEADAALWPSFLPSNLVNLGLDLRGGAHLLVEVQVEDVHASFLEGFWPSVRDALAAERDVVGFVTREDSPPTELRVRISQPEGANRAFELVRGLGTPVASFTGGAASNIDVRINGPILTITLSEAEMVAMNERTIMQTLEIIRRRIDEVGTREPTIQR
ncbi:MAG: protein translocase subunit SecD, partial [Yoonia sp.]|nr:protein translocase subunit SecD [Yoonia sp.]